MGVKFTDEQLKAIETLDKSVLVSAAAGSGKTAVLVERILRIILDGRANVDEMLIVTFTRAAASEMKLRLASAIRKRMKESPEDADRLADQISRLSRAYITTIDSFAMRVIREFFYEIDIEPDFGACDEVQGELMRREALQELFEEGFEHDDFLDNRSGDIKATGNGPDDNVFPENAQAVGFREFLRLYSEERQEDTFKDNLLKTYDGLRSIPDYFAWAYDRAEMLRVTPETFDGSKLQAVIREDATDTWGRIFDAAQEIRSIMQGAGLDDMFNEKLSDEFNLIHDIYMDASEGRVDDAFFDRAASITFNALRTKKAWQESYEPLKDEIKRIRDSYKEEIKSWNLKYMTPDFNSRLSEMNETYRYTIYYIRLLEEFERRYLDKKRERHVMDFSDMEHNAVRILREKETADVLRKRFRYIFVDEYQDTNRIQEALISSISRPDNVFRVGDVKQSIYKFRQAEPSIFEDLYRRFSDKEGREGIAIDLSANFRSNKATVSYINRVFEEIMPGYDERARLYPKAECPPEYDFIPEVHLLTEDDDSGQDSVDDSNINTDIDTDEGIQAISKEEAEAAYIAGLVRNLIGTEFYDTKAQVVRKVEAGDIVILFRSVKVRGDIMARALREQGVEPYVEESDDYFDTVEIGIALSMLSCIDNMKRDVPLIATLHSEAFGWSAEELASVRIAHSEHLRNLREKDKTYTGSVQRPSYYDALKWYHDEGPEGELKTKALFAASRIAEWRKLSRMMPLDDFVWHVLTESGYYRMAGAMNGGARRQANLRTLADRAGKFSSEGIASLSTFISFVDVMRQKGIVNGQVPVAGSGDNVIRISTIHKSKGLEYPFVIVGGLGHQFRYNNNEKAFSFDADIGVSLPYIDPGRKYWRSTIVQRAINSKSRRDIYAEDLRVLYVAMTRARNKLILTGICSSEADLMKYSMKPANYLKVLKNVVKTGFNTYHISPLETFTSAGSSAMRKVPDPSGLLLDERELLMEEELDRRFSYEYPDTDLLTSKAKYSVSALRREALASENEMVGRSEVPAGKKDTAYGFKSPAAEKKRIDTLSAEDNALDETDRAAVVQPDTEVVNLWLSSENRKRASSTDIGIAYHRIMEFVDFARAASPDGSIDEEYIQERAEILRDQGAIDKDVYDSLDIDRICGFFRADIGKRAALAAHRGSLKKEKAFTLKTERDGHSILVQGVIDCCFEEDGSMILIDYKSNFIRPGRDHASELERIRHEYRVQIELYRDAILKGTGKDVSEAYLYLFRTGEALDMLKG